MVTLLGVLYKNGHRDRTLLLILASFVLLVGWLYLKIKCNDSKEKVRTKEKNSGGKRKFVVCFLHKGCILFRDSTATSSKVSADVKKAFFEKLKNRTGLTEDSFGDYNSDIYWIANSYFVKDENSVHCKKLNNWLDMFGCLRNYAYYSKYIIRMYALEKDPEKNSSEKR